MMALIFITHPEVIVDPRTPVPRWRLSDRGVERMRTFVASSAVEHVTQVWASTETKAIEAAGLLAARFGLPVQVHPGLGENDRSATGFLPPEEFEIQADAFFAHPAVSVQGWETANAAQLRIAGAVLGIVARSDDVAGDVAIVAHGGVGTLLLCKLSGEPISRVRDQPFQGHFWKYETKTKRMLHGWAPIAPR